MKRPSTPPILSEVRTASSPASQVKALKVLKNELIGHEQKKEQWVKLGVLTTLAHILTSTKDNGKNKHREDIGVASYSRAQDEQSEDEEARLQAVIVIGSVAYGGPAFVAPIYAANIVSSLLSLLSRFESHPQTTLHILKTLNTIANSVCLSSSEQEDNGKSLTTLLYSQHGLSSLSDIIRQTSLTPVVQQQIILASSLISKTCQKEHQRASAVQASVLEALTVTSAPLILDSLRYPFYAKAKTPLASILDAVKAVIGATQSRGILFLVGLDQSVSKLDQASNLAHDGYKFTSISSKMSHNPQNSLKPVNSLLPQLPNTKAANVSKFHDGFPTPSQVGMSNRQTQSPRSMSTAIEVNQRQGLENVSEEESPLISLLVHIFRSSDDAVSLAAAGLLVAFHRLGLTKRTKEPMFALLLVPSLVRMLSTDAKASIDDFSGGSNSTMRSIKEEASAILATLTNGCIETQNAAFDAGAIKKLSQLLKESFDPLPASESDQIWIPESPYSPQGQSREDAHRLGPSGITLATYNTLRLREAVLSALAAIASEKDEYRKTVIDNGVVPFVIKSLQTEPTESMVDGPIGGAAIIPQLSTRYHRDVALAACGTARALSRSVSTLRTSLMDAGLPSPLFSLLNSQDLEIQIAATGVLCNLVLKFSPMREVIMAGGALKALCSQAHSMNAKLRLNSMWALKNIIAGASNSTKKTCLEELGPGWLKQIVAHDVEDSTFQSFLVNSRHGDRDDETSTLMRMSTPNAAGEQVDLLNAVEDDSRDSSQGLDENEAEDLEMSDSIGALSKVDRDKKYQSTATNTNKPFMWVPNSETGSQNHAHRALSDELAIQKEGLEFIRNLICGDQSPDMIDHLFRELGQDKVFEMLTSKLRPRILNVFSRDRRSTENGVRQVQPHSEVLTSACYTVVHIACGRPKHRQLLVSQTELLKLLLPLFNHVSREIRVCLCWVVINVTWVEDSTDEQNAKLRARELQNLGFIEKLDALEKDEILDCRERAKNARDQMRRLLHV